MSLQIACSCGGRPHTKALSFHYSAELFVWGSASVIVRSNDTRNLCTFSAPLSRASWCAINLSEGQSNEEAPNDLSEGEQ